MTPTRRHMLQGLAAAAAPWSAFAQPTDEDQQVQDAFLTLVFGLSTDIPDAMSFLVYRGDTDVVSGLIFALRFSRYGRQAFLRALEALTGETGRPDWPSLML